MQENVRAATLVSVRVDERVPLLDAPRVEPKAEAMGESERSFVLLAVDSARDLDVVAVLADLPGDVVLRHQVPEPRHPRRQSSSPKYGK